VSTLEHVKAKLGRTPLIIFDQFDDYQTRHRAQFLAGRRRTWLSTNRLITANAFWGDIKEAIDNHTVHCLFATRADTADALESIRLAVPQVYRLDRLHADVVLPLLTERMANTAIHSGLTKRQVRTLLVSLADAESLKTMPSTSAGEMQTTG
jgi:hypothetical protein